jgi:A/G-specific adenine glycosylase
MLQQTRVTAVIPYFERFLARFPTLEALATAPEEDLLKAWAGLGYYSRARNLQKAARTMTRDFPTSYDGIRALPGVGDYTAAAVASIAFGLPYAAIDGNVARVMSRLTNGVGDYSRGSAGSTRSLPSRSLQRSDDGTRRDHLSAEKPAMPLMSGSAILRGASRWNPGRNTCQARAENGPCGTNFARYPSWRKNAILAA